MRKGSINSATRLLNNATGIQNDVLPLIKPNLMQLKQKHVQGSEEDQRNCYLTYQKKFTQIALSIDAESLREAALKTKGGAGTSGPDAD